MDHDDCSVLSTSSPASPYGILFTALSLIPLSHYILFLLLLLLAFLYNFLEIHFLRDFISGFRGGPVSLTFNPSSYLYRSIASACPLLHGRYYPTPWLCSPHLQTAFLSLFGKSPQFTYTRHLFHAADGGTIALDWLMHSDAKGDTSLPNDKAPIMIVIPGLTSDSASAYIKHLAFKMAREGWNVVVSNHRGLGGISITSDCFYNAGWTEDIRKVVDHIHCQHPEAPLYAVGTSIGANILVKYLGEDGDNIPLIGAAAVCSPWDLLICDRFINRRLVQKLYDRMLTLGLRGYAQLHQSVISRLTDWDNIRKSCSVRDFDNHATRVLGKFETVDTYYRRSSCVNFVGHVSVPLLCISALDDPVCTREAIPWDECRANENIILATTQHGGHLAYYEGIAANSLWPEDLLRIMSIPSLQSDYSLIAVKQAHNVGLSWIGWVRVVDEFLRAVHSSSFKNRRKKERTSSPAILVESSIDQGPYVNVMEDGMVAAIVSSPRNDVGESMPNEMVHDVSDDEDTISKAEGRFNMMKQSNSEIDIKLPASPNLHALTDPVKRCIDQLSRQNRTSICLLAYVAIITTWPLVGSALLLFIKKRFKAIMPAALLGR